MATDVSICSNALLLLGAQTINSLSEGTDRAKIAANLFETVRDGILRAHPWNCCIKRVVLSPDVAAPAFDWAYQYDVPDDFVKALAVGELGLETDFRLEGRRILCDENPVYLRYVSKNTNPATWDAGLVNAVTAAMAAAMSYPITQSATLAQTMQEQASMTLRTAKSVDGQDDTPEMLGDERLLGARFGGFW